MKTKKFLLIIMILFSGYLSGCGGDETYTIYDQTTVLITRENVTIIHSNGTQEVIPIPPQTPIKIECTKEHEDHESQEGDDHENHEEAK